MARDEPITITPDQGWVEATDAAVETVDLFSVNGAHPLLVRFQDAAPVTTNNGDGVPWSPGQAEADLTMPGGAATRMWVWAAFGGTTTFYIKHA